MTNLWNCSSTFISIIQIKCPGTKLGSCLSGNIDLAVVGHNWCQMCFSSKLSKIKTIPLYFNHFESFSCATLGCQAASGSSTNRNKEGFSLLHVNWNNTTILSISGHFFKEWQDHRSLHFALLWFWSLGLCSYWLP